MLSSYIEFTEKMLIPTREIFDPVDDYDALYSFRASDSYGFSLYPCSSPECRLNKTHSLAVFGSLYANRIYIPNPFETFIDSPDTESSNLELLGSVASLLYLEPFAKYGMLGLRNSYLSLCSEHKEEIKAFENEAKEKTEIIHSLLKDEYRQCEARVMKHPKYGYYFVRVTGPEALIDHDAVDLIGDPAIKAFKNFKYDLIDKDYMLENLLPGFIYSATHTIIESELEKFYKSSTYLTSRDVEAKVMEISGGTLNASKSQKLTSTISHDVPFLDNISVWKMLEFREYEGEKFENYRDAVKRAIREYDSKNKDSNEIVNDIILPEIHKIDSTMKRYKESQSRSTKLEVGLGLGGLLIGLSGISSVPTLSSAITALGGMATIRSLGQKLLDKDTPPKEVFDNDYYFLWKMNKTYN
ncbi:hypothetical protein ACFOPQ_13780 [Deinococcus antarcticus]|uniref:Uncharacterized protein n=1 Tax=Deinococcus antarcticus TaxID=1298767 RepID=A0ABV8A7Y6_9DEIO